jgi:ferric-dicitrate binding protein FerR (iron transport regulator)
LLPQIVKDNNLNKAQQSELAAVMKTEMSYWKPKDKALEDAAKLCWFTNKEAIDAAETNAYQRWQSALPKKWNAYAPVRRMNTITLAEYDAMPPKQKTAYIKDSTERHGELLFK